jgi:hypothetical protein
MAQYTGDMELYSLFLNRFFLLKPLIMGEKEGMAVLGKQFTRFIVNGMAPGKIAGLTKKKSKSVLKRKI